MGCNSRFIPPTAIGRGQMRVPDERVHACRRIFDRYAEALADIDGVDFMPEAPYGHSNRWLTSSHSIQPDAACRPLN